jgi:hypothetical protein
LGSRSAGGSPRCGDGQLAGANQRDDGVLMFAKAMMGSAQAITGRELALGIVVDVVDLGLRQRLADLDAEAIAG